MELAIWRFLIHQNDEFVTGKARDGVARANALRHPFSNRLEYRISSAVAETVVDILEPVEVHEHGGDPFPVPFCLRDRTVQALSEEDSIGEPGQRIMVRHVVDLRFGPFLVGHIAAYAD